MAFSEFNITPEMLEKKLGHPLAQCSPAEIAELRTTYKSIADGNSTWADYAAAASEKVANELGDVARKSEAPKTGTPAEQKADAWPESDLPIDVNKPYLVEDVTAATKKNGPFTVTLAGGTKLSCSDQRLYITAASARQSKSQVRIAARMDGAVLILTDIEELP
jgi:hypothetical protein